MSDVPWFTIATLATAAVSMLQGLQDQMPAEYATAIAGAVVILGGIAKVAYAFATSQPGEDAAERIPALASGPDPTAAVEEPAEGGFNVEELEALDAGVEG